jgi:hypothetical protein
MDFIQAMQWFICGQFGMASESDDKSNKTLLFIPPQMTYIAWNCKIMKNGDSSNMQLTNKIIIKISVI